ISIVVSGERCHLALFVFHSEGGIRQRFRTGTISSDRPALSRTNCNYSFDACFCSGRSLPRSETSAHNRQNEHGYWKPQHSNLSPWDPSRSTMTKHRLRAILPPRCVHSWSESELDLTTDSLR